MISAGGGFRAELPATFHRSSVLHIQWEARRACEKRRWTGAAGLLWVRLASLSCDRGSGVMHRSVSSVQLWVSPTRTFVKAHTAKDAVLWQKMIGWGARRACARDLCKTSLFPASATRTTKVNILCYESSSLTNSSFFCADLQRFFFVCVCLAKR